MPHVPMTGSPRGWPPNASPEDSGCCAGQGSPLRTATGPDADDPLVRGKGETILLADDDRIVRLLGQVILQKYNYQVLLAEDGVEAVERMRAEGAGVDLVILDVTMPRLGGREAARRIAELVPGVRVVFSSGLIDALSDEDRARWHGFIDKPCQPEHLLRTVRAALDGRGAAP